MGTPLTSLAHLVRIALLPEHDDRLKGIAAAPQRATGQQLLVLSALLQPQQRRLGRRRERKPVCLMPVRHMVTPEMLRRAFPRSFPSVQSKEALDRPCYGGSQT